jgi:hypothetical protein
MTNQKNGSATATAKQPACAPCAVPALCRSNYYTGKLLTERDFKEEQRYHTDKLRLHYMALHGWGLVCGLTVHPHPHCPKLRIVVEEGLGIDDCGREVRLLRDMELALPQPDTTTTPAQPCPPDPSQGQPPPNQTPGTPGQNPTGAEPKAEQRDTDEGTDLYVCIRYCENPLEYTPAPFDDCGCNANGQQPNRICESSELKIFEGEPDFMKKIHEYRHCCEEDDCIEIYKRVLKHCHCPGRIGWLPLAVIKNFIAGQAVTEAMIDNWTVRPILPSTRMLDHLIQCILDRLPPAPLTTIVNFNWGHGEVYNCKEFLNTYVGRQDTTRGFEVEFSGAVHPDGITANSFQAEIVRLPQNAQQARAVEVLPGSVTVAADGKSCTLSIDSTYARDLDGQNFDVYIRLRCDVIVDERGHAVDGDLLARYANGAYVVDGPTGDGIPGGLFESWIQVRMAGAKRL